MNDGDGDGDDDDDGDNAAATTTAADNDNDDDVIEGSRTAILVLNARTALVAILFSKTLAMFDTPAITRGVWFACEITSGDGDGDGS